MSTVKNVAQGRSFRIIAMSGLLAVALLGRAPHPAAAVPARTPVETGCPAGYERLSVAALVSLGYRLPISLDAAGNNDGWVCGHAFADAAAAQLCPDCPVDILYLFEENDLPAFGRPGK